jgi:hypothetical protein
VLRVRFLPAPCWGLAGAPRRHGRCTADRCIRGTSANEFDVPGRKGRSSSRLGEFAQRIPAPIHDLARNSTRFLASDEALTSAAAKAKLVAAHGDDTIRTRVFDIVRSLDWPVLYTGRALHNAFSRQWHGREAELEKSLPAEAPRYARAAEANDLDTSVVFAGECVDLIRDVKPRDRWDYEQIHGRDAIGTPQRKTPLRAALAPPDHQFFHFVDPVLV